MLDTKINDKELSRIFFVATDRIQDAGGNLYELLHDREGRPVKDINTVLDAIAKVRRSINIELDLIKTALEEVSEYDKQ